MVFDQKMENKELKNSPCIFRCNNWHVRLIGELQRWRSRHSCRSNILLRICRYASHLKWHDTNLEKNLISFTHDSWQMNFNISKMFRNMWGNWVSATTQAHHHHRKHPADTMCVQSSTFLINRLHYFSIVFDECGKCFHPSKSASLLLVMCNVWRSLFFSSRFNEKDTDIVVHLILRLDNWKSLRTALSERVVKQARSTELWLFFMQLIERYFRLIFEKKPELQ